jgi:hypothetical protein
MIIDPTDIRRIHIEITSRCNAACPDCPRTGNSTLPITELSYKDFKTCIPPSILEGLTSVGFCGNYGDPIVAKELLEICAYIRKHSDCRIGIHTNGSARKASWWKSLAETIHPDGYVMWALDGLKDTNHIYRVGTRWDIIMRNVKAFNEAGGESHWQFIVFDHNKHQVELAKATSYKLGFAKFIKTPARQCEQSSTVVRFDWDSAPGPKPESEPFAVSCLATERKMIYLSAEGLVFPCCWTANIYHTTLDSSSLAHRHGADSINATRHSIAKIVNGEMWQEIEEWKLKACHQKCGINEPQPVLNYTSFDS